MLAAVAVVVSGVTIGAVWIRLDHEVSLIHGWLPWTVQVIAAVALAAAVGWRSRWWRLVCVPSAGLVGVVAAGVRSVGTSTRQVWVTLRRCRCRSGSG